MAATKKKATKKKATKKRGPKLVRVNLIGDEPGDWEDMSPEPYRNMGDPEPDKALVVGRARLSLAEYDNMMLTGKLPSKLRKVPIPHESGYMTALEVGAPRRSTIYLVDTEPRMTQVYAVMGRRKTWYPWKTKEMPLVYRPHKVSKAEAEEGMRKIREAQARMSGKRKTIRQRARCYWYGDC